MERAYPTENGLPLSTSEIRLPASHLNPELRASYNNHHLEFTRRAMGRLLITKTLRDLEFMQEDMLRDAHAELHRIFSPPEAPTLLQAMDRIDVAVETGEHLKVYDLAQHRYFYQPISGIHQQQLRQEYNREAA
jgi:hypothetical protein